MKVQRLLRVAALLMGVQALLLWAMGSHAWQMFYAASEDDFLTPDLPGRLMHLRGGLHVHQDYFEGAALLASLLLGAMGAMLWQVADLSRAAPAVAQRLLLAPLAVCGGSIVVFVGHFSVVNLVLLLATGALVTGAHSVLSAEGRAAARRDGSA